MFDLDREVTAWSAAIHATGCRSAAEVAELSDHLYCEIDRARAEGLSDEGAFRAAVARVGSARELMAEHAKNRSALGTVCQVAARLDGVANPDHRPFLLAHAVIWAALIIASSLVLPKAVAVWFLVVASPLWWASDQLLRAALRNRSVSGS
jgi:hypothetical protein